MSGYVWTDRRVRRALDLAVERADEELAYAGVTTDSRAVEEGELFVALRGERFDGHDFVADAVAAGAAGAVVSRPVAGAEGVPIYPVDDTLEALGSLARHRRRALDVPVIAVTGSSGKTTTRALLQGALAVDRRVHATRGNLNNRIGLPLTLLDAPDDADVVVLEMGTNEPGEIEALTGIAEPGYGIVTTVSESHLEKLASLEGVLEEKLSLLRGLRPPRFGVVSDEPPELAGAARKTGATIRVAGWSDRADADLRPSEPESDSKGRFHFRWRDETVTLRIPGRHAVLDAVLALAVAEELGVDPGDAARGVGSVEPMPMRGEVRTVGALTLIVDCYNANPESVDAALELLSTFPELGRRVAVLGTMLELGDRSPELHREVLRRATEGAVDVVVAVGGFARAARELRDAGLVDDGPRVVAVDEAEEAYPALAAELEGGEVVLLKASRGVALERLIPRLEEEFGSDGEGEPAERDDANGTGAAEAEEADTAGEDGEG